MKPLHITPPAEKFTSTRAQLAAVFFDILVMTRKSCRTPRGFTLFDACIGLGLLTGTIAVALPTWRDLQRFYLTREARLVEHRLRGLVTEALASRRDLTLQITPTAITVAHPDGTRVSHPIHPNVAAHLTATAPDTLTLFGHGVHSPGTIVLSSGSFRCSISLSLRGRVRRVC